MKVYKIIIKLYANDEEHAIDELTRVVTRAASQNLPARSRFSKMVEMFKTAWIKEDKSS